MLRDSDVERIRDWYRKAGADREVSVGFAWAVWQGLDALGIGLRAIGRAVST